LAWQAYGETKEFMKKVVIFWTVLPATAYPCMEAGLFPDIVFIVLDEVNYQIVCTIMVLQHWSFLCPDITVLFIPSFSTYIALSRHDLKKKTKCHS